MTTTELYSGYSSEGKPSSRVLRPPGGGSSNIFGGDEPTPQQQVRKEQQQEASQQQATAGSNPTLEAKQEYQRNKPKGKADAPFACFAESGKTSDPTQFDRCNEESQKDADFRCYSVSAYREAVVQNAAVRERARGAASGSVNPITHEEKNASPFERYENNRVHPQAVAQKQTKRTVRGQPNNASKVQYNPITGEEYPADYGKQNSEDNNQEEQNSTETSEETSQDNNTSDDKTDEAQPATTEAAPEQTDTPRKPKPTAVKVRQPPGGKSSGPLW